MSGKDPMGTSASVVEEPVLPGTYEPDDTIDLLDDPYGHLERIQKAWRSKNREEPWSKDNLLEVDLGNVDWRLYGPPAALADSQDVASEILQEIIASSLQNISNKNKQELQSEKDEEVARKAAEDEAAKEAEKNKEPYLPIKIVERKDDAEEHADTTESAEEPAGTEIKPDCDTGSIKDSVSIIQARVEKRRMFAIKNLFQRSTERAESSAAGAAREAMRKQLENRLSRVNIESTAPAAQETIAELRRHKSVRVPETQELVECVSCLDEFAKKAVIKVPCHSYCHDCFVRLIEAACQNEQQWPPKCCLNEIPFRIINKYVPEDLKTTFHNCQREWKIPVAERLYCHEPECSALIKPKDINQAKKIGRCRQAHHTCTMCRGKSHGKRECPQDQDMILTNNLAEQEGWKRCTQCHALVEHREACQHMTCRCGYQFCYVCNRRWRTCSCTMQQLDELKSASDARREQRQLREEAEASELREILRQIEQFELKEARRAEEERLEQQRLAEERWQKIIKERLIMETVRRKSVETRFQQLRDLLDRVHESQRANVTKQQDDDSCDLATDCKSKEGELHKAQENELLAIKSRVSIRVSEKEAVFDKEYALRAVKERNIEQEYEQQLKLYWTGDKENSEKEIDTAMHLLRRRMDQSYLSWQKWKNAELATYRGKLEDEQSIREELMYSARHRLKGRHQCLENELAKRMVAERKWVHEAILERERLLMTAETAEMEGDADSLFAEDREAEAAEGEAERAAQAV